MSPPYLRVAAPPAYTSFDPAAARTGGEASSPAFRLPFEDLESGNHVAQWVTSGERLDCTDTSKCGVGEFRRTCVPNFI